MTRDPQRIDETIEIIKAIWKKHPDLRLGQLLCNLGNYQVVYYIEDAEMLNALYAIYGKPEIEPKPVIQPVEVKPVAVKPVVTTKKSKPATKKNTRK